MKITTMRLPKVLDMIEDGTLAHRKTFQDTRTGLLTAAEKGWPIGLITVVEQDGVLVVQDGARRLGALHRGLRRPGVVRLAGQTPRYATGKHEGIPAHILIRTLDFLSWLESGPKELSDVAHKAATRLNRYEIPFARVEYGRGLRAWLER